MSNHQVSDQQQRDQALDPTRSFAVSAPAGSGKTGLLTQRVLTLLANCDQPEEVLAITFTRKAAAEMRHRIIDALQVTHDQIKSGQPAPDQPYLLQTWKLAKKVLERDQLHNWQLLAAPNRLKIQTIDGLCRDLARQLVLENGLGELPQPADDSSANYQQAVHNLLQLLNGDGAASEALSTLLRHLDNNLARVESLLSSLLTKREQWLDIMVGARNQHARQYLEQQLEQVILDAMHSATAKLTYLQSELMLLVDYAASNLVDGHSDHPICQLQGATSLPEADPEYTSVWQALTEILLTRDGNWRKTIDARSGFPAGKGEPQTWKARWKDLLAECQSIPGLLEVLVALRHLPYSCYPEKQWRLLDSLTTLLPRLSAELSLQFIASGNCDFTEITLAALNALGEEQAPTDTALKLDYQIQHILIDEFQDTSSVQFQLLRKLTAGWQPGDGRTLFIVGDGMQSLYGFRSANVGLFLEARQQPIGDIELTPLDLTVNFRSQQQIVEWVNDTFQSAFPDEDDINRGAVSYSLADAFNPPLDNKAVSVDLFTDQDDRSLEAKEVVKAVQEAQQVNPDGTIAILVRNRNHLKEIIPALYQAGLSWQAIDIEPLRNRMAVMDCHSLTRALLDPSDRIAWLSILRAPWCGLDNADLLSLANTELADLNPIAKGEQFPMIWGQLQHHQQISSLSESAKNILARVTKALGKALQHQGRKTVRSWIEGTWIELGGPSALIDANDVAHVRRYFDLLEQHSSEAAIEDWNAFDQAVSRLYAAPASDSNPKLQVMTIHKSKGLEFDTVIIPGLDTTPRSGDSNMLMWRERLDSQGDSQLLLGPLQASEDLSDSLYEHLKYEQKLKDRLENTRVIYVAATRAIKRLHLLANVKTDSKQNLKAPGSDSLLAPIWPKLSQRIEQDDPTIQCHITENEQQHKTIEAPTLDKIVRLPDNWLLPDNNHNEPLESFRGRTEGYQVDKSEPGVDNRSARHLGTVLHQTLQQIAIDGIEHWSEDRIKRQHSFWRAQLTQLGVTDTDTAIEKLQKAVIQITADKDGCWVLNGKHEASECELLLFSRSKSGKTRKSVVDRTFICGDVRWIVDYKSAEPAPGIEIEEFIRAEIEHYRPQLNRYAQQFKLLESREIKTALYFPLLPKLVLVD